MRENYYILLELNPSIKDDATINAAISKKQSDWGFERNHPTKGTVAQQKLSKIPDIKVVLLNPELRDKEAEEAKRILISIEQEKNKDLIAAGSWLVKNGEISKNELQALLKKPKFKGITEEEALKTLKAKIKKEEITYKDDGIVLLDSSLMKEIKTELGIVNKKNLFDFLELSPTSNCSTILKKANELYTQFSKNTNKDKAEITASINLANKCLSYLKDDAIKKRYQKSLEFESFSVINEPIELAAIDGIIDASEFEKLVQKCTENGISIDRAEYYIFEYCKKKGFPPPQKTENAEYKKQVQCSVCHHLNDPIANNCGNCASPLKVICPNCSHQANSIDNACVECGFHIGDMPNAIYLIRCQVSQRC
jgi:hypothetical protein